MATLKEFKNVDNAIATYPEYRTKLTQMYQYMNRSVKKFLFDAGVGISAKEFANNTAALAGGLKPGDLYSTPAGDVKVVK